MWISSKCLKKHLNSEKVEYSVNSLMWWTLTIVVGMFYLNTENFLF